MDLLNAIGHKLMIVHSSSRWLLLRLDSFNRVSVTPHAVLVAEDFSILGEKGLVNETVTADGTLEALWAGMPVPALVR